MMKTEAMVHSLKEVRKVTILEKEQGENSYIAFYDGKLCSAIYNPFVGLFYVDDIYGVLEGGEQQ